MSDAHQSVKAILNYLCSFHFFHYKSFSLLPVSPLYLNYNPTLEYVSQKNQVDVYSTSKKGFESLISQPAKRTPCLLVGREMIVFGEK